MRPCHGYERTPALELVEFMSLAWGCQSQRPGCLIDLVGADSLPAEPLSASAVMQERRKEPLILLSDYLTFCRVI